MAPGQDSGDSSRGRLPIRDYALIGDCHGSALVGRNGSIDWCCLGRFDADPIFCRILDLNRGGYLSVTPLERFSVARSYLDGANILQTVFTTEGADVVVTDFMPVGRQPGSGVHDYVDLVAPGWLIRLVEIRRGSAELCIRYRPTLEFGQKLAQLDIRQDCISAENGPVLYHNTSGFTVTHDEARATTRLTSGRRLVLVLSGRPMDDVNPIDRVDRLYDITSAFWREWIAYCRYRGPYRDAVRRSLLTIKLLIYAPSGAITAAPTTSLPEKIGGTRNWDYRYCWLRDAAFALYALAVTGYGGEARRFSMYLPRVCAATFPDLRIMYGIDGEIDLEERVIEQFEGHRCSRPVRVGNAAYIQRQIDVYGEILDWALLFEALGGSFSSDSRSMLAAFADYVAEHWHEPDQGLWEMRGPPLHHVHGKIMSWVALDRAIRLLGQNKRWQDERDRIAAEVSARGRGPGDEHLIQAYGRPGVDASLLLTPMTAFPIHDDTLRNTIAAIEKELRSGDFVYRYRTEDGVEGDEGAFLICSFWLVDALLHLGREKDAEELFGRLLACANDVGLFSEEIDVEDHAFLGNFPQTYTHLALIGSAVHFELYAKGGPPALEGSHAERAKRAVSATLGWRAIWAAFKATWRVGRLLSSKKSMMLGVDSSGPALAR